MLLVHTPKVTPRIDFVFKHICTRVLGIKVGFTSVVQDFIAHQGPKFTYGSSPLDSELFIKSHGLLNNQGVEDIPIHVEPWDSTIGFFKVGRKSALPFDIFSASFYLLSRYEEYLPHVKDEKGRFPAAQSIAEKNGFIRQPVVDIWAYKLLGVLRARFPDLDLPQKSVSIQSLVVVEEPFKYAQKGLARTLIGIGMDFYTMRFRDLWKRLQVILGYKKDPYDIYQWLINVSKKGSYKLSLFFMMGDHHQVQKGFNPNRKRFTDSIKLTADYCQLGLMLSDYAIEDVRFLLEEKKMLEELTYRSIVGSLNYEYVVNLPERYRKLVEGEIQRDYSMVYEDVVGFRSGSCTPFLFYDLDYEIKTPLVIHPVAFTTRAFNKRYASDSLQQINRIFNSVAKVNGTFSVFFSNEDLVDIPGNSIWRTLLSETLTGYER